MFEDGLGSGGTFFGILRTFSHIGFETVVRYENTVLCKGVSYVDSRQGPLAFVEVLHSIEAKNKIVFAAIVESEFLKAGRRQITLKRMKFFHDSGRNRQSTQRYRVGIQGAWRGSAALLRRVFRCHSRK